MTSLGLQVPESEDSTPLDAESVRRRGAHPLLGVVIGGGIIVVLLVLSLIHFRYSPTKADATAILKGPNSAHCFGTDQAGYDVFARTLAAAHIDIPIAIGGTLIAMIVGTAIGLLASMGGRTGRFIMRCVDLLQAFPLLVLILVIVTLTKGGVAIITCSVAIANIPPFIRLTRAEALAVLQSRFVFFSRVIGSSRWAIIRRHLLPNASGVIVVQASIGCATAVGVIAAISFLGAGIAPPTASWGSMIQSGAEGIGSGNWWPVVFPAAALALTIFSLNLIADRLDAYYSRTSS